MGKRPFFSDPHAHGDGPPRPFGTVHKPGSEPTPRQQRERYVQPVGVLPAVQSLLYLLVVALFVITFTAQPIRIPSASMEPTLLVGDFLLLDKQAVAPSLAEARGPLPPTAIRRGDVIVFHDPVEDASIHLVKRVIGIPGDRIRLQDGSVIRNGTAIAEPYAIHRPSPPDPFRDDFPNLQSMDAAVNPAWWISLRGLVHDGEITVPPGKYFVLGDNRNDSADSRYWGFVPRNAIVGKPLLIYFSWKAPPGPQQGPVQAPVQETAGPGDFARWDRTFRVVH